MVGMPCTPYLVAHSGFSSVLTLATTTFPGISPTKAREVLQTTDQMIRQFAEVEHVFGKIGRAETAPKPGKLSFKQMRELEGIEPQILALEKEIARIEGLFVSPDFHRTHATQTNELLAQLAAAKEKLPRLYARW